MKSEKEIENQVGSEEGWTIEELAEGEHDNTVYRILKN